MLDDGAMDDAMDALAPHGAPEQVSAAVRGHLDAGADHVRVQFLPAREDPTRAMERFAEAFGLGR